VYPVVSKKCALGFLNHQQMGELGMVLSISEWAGPRGIAGPGVTRFPWKVAVHGLVATWSKRFRASGGIWRWLETPRWIELPEVVARGFI